MKYLLSQEEMDGLVPKEQMAEAEQVIAVLKDMVLSAHHYICIHYEVRDTPYMNYCSGCPLDPMDPADGADGNVLWSKHMNCLRNYGK